MTSHRYMIDIWNNIHFFLFGSYTFILVDCCGMTIFLLTGSIWVLFCLRFQSLIQRTQSCIVKPPFKSSYTTCLFLVIFNDKRRKMVLRTLKGRWSCGWILWTDWSRSEKFILSTIIHDLMNVVCSRDAILRIVWLGFPISLW